MFGCISDYKTDLEDRGGIFIPLIFYPRSSLAQT